MADNQVTEKIAQLEQELQQSRNHEKALGILLEKKLNELYIHYHISRTIGSLLDLQETLSKVTEIIQKTLPFERISVYLVDEKREYLSLAFSKGLQIQEMRLAIGEGTPGRIVENGEHVHIHDLSIFYKTFNDFIHYSGEEKRGGSYVGIALKVHNVTIGVIGMDNSSQYGLSVDDMDFMAILSHQLAAGIEKSLLFEKIQHMSQHDGLTSLFNYRMFRERLQQEIARRNRTRKPLSLLMLDIDHFKQFNDTYGHQAGDELLKELSAIITRQSRSDSLDICCRYGGEEFVVIMPELELHHAMVVAERIRKSVEEHHFTLQDASRSGKVTVSLGVASLAENEDMTIEEVIKHADEALYLSKRNGRNRVSYLPANTENPRC
ncbi:MAG: sensor domain-containing diguanylate cyclase [Nitrospirota bacterium]